MSKLDIFLRLTAFVLILGMKKTILALFLLLCTVSIQAQTVDSYGIPVHSLNVQASDALVPTFATSLVIALGYALGAGIAAVISNGNAEVDAPEFKGWIPFVSAGYEYHFPDTRWSLGPELGYWHYGLESNDNYQHIHFLTLTANGKLYYKRAGICKLYGGLNVGVGLVASQGASPIPVVQLNPIGMRLGGEKAAFVAELGAGYLGFLQLGANIAL